MNSNREIYNPRTGQRMIFLKTGKDSEGNLLEIECFNPPSTEREPEHIHPIQESSCEVISGKLQFNIGGIRKEIKAGESVIIPAGVPHHFWNEENTEAHHLQRFSPALHIDDFFRTFFALARDGKLNRKGLPNFFIISLLSMKHQDEIRLTKPPWLVQKFTFLLLAPIARVLGYRSSYK
jgi:quercetin dioxygenase-like cupin family protein